MTLTIEIKIVKIGNSLRITIPKDVARTLGWKEGDILQIGVVDETMTAKKASE